MRLPNTKNDLCDACGKEPCTHVTIQGNTGAMRRLCRACFEAAAPDDERKLIADLANARCQYCGAKAQSSDLDYLALAEGIERRWILCDACAQEHVRFLHAQSDRLSSPVLGEALDAHMKQWVANAS